MSQPLPQLMRIATEGPELTEIYFDKILDPLDNRMDQL